MVKVFKINLNKYEGLAEREARWKKRREMLVISSFFIIFALLSLYAFRNHQALNDIIDAKEERISGIESRLTELAASGKNIAKNDVLTLARMEKDRFLWATKLKALGEILPEEVALTMLDYNYRELRIKAISKIMTDEKEFDKVSQFMDMLKTTPFFYREFSNIRFSESHRIRIEKQDILSLVITCQIAKSSSKTGSRSSRTSG